LKVGARKKIYVPIYNWALENKLGIEVQELKTIHSRKDIILLDYETNKDLENDSEPLSHASLIKKFILNR